MTLNDRSKGFCELIDRSELHLGSTFRLLLLQGKPSIVQGLGMRWLGLVSLLLSLAAVQTGGENEQSELGRQNRDHYPFGQSHDIPEYEIVIARYKENSTTLAWLSELPSFYQVTIINKVDSSAEKQSCAASHASNHMLKLNSLLCPTAKEGSCNYICHHVEIVGWLDVPYAGLAKGQELYHRQCHQ